MRLPESWLSSTIDYCKGSGNRVLERNEFFEKIKFTDKFLLLEIFKHDYLSKLAKIFSKFAKNLRKSKTGLHGFCRAKV